MGKYFLVTFLVSLLASNCFLIQVKAQTVSHFYSSEFLNLYGLNVEEQHFLESVDILNYKNKLSGCQSLTIFAENSDTLSKHGGEFIIPNNSMPLIVFYPALAQNKSFGSKMFLTKYSRSCSLTIYFHLKHESWSWIGDQNQLFEIIPGGIFYSFHLVITKYNFRQLNLFERPVPLILTQMHNVLILVERRNWYDNGKVATYMTPNVWYNDSIYLSSNNFHLVYSKWFNFGSFGPLVIATTPDNLQSDIDYYLKTKNVKKFIITCFSEMLHFMNTTGTLLPVQSGIYGQKDKRTGKWQGLVAKLYSGEAHLTTIVALGGDRLEIIKYGTIFAVDHVIFITGLPKETNLPGSLSFLISPFTLVLWICVLLCFVILYMVLFVTKSVEDGGFSRVVGLGLLNIILRSIVDQTGDTRSLIKKLLKSNVMRFVFILWLLGIIVLSSGYKSKFISSFVTPYIKHPPKTWKELSESNYEIGGVLYNQSIVGPSFRQLNNSIGRAVVSRIKEHQLLEPECYKAVEKGEKVCLGLKEFVKSVANLYLTDRRGKSMYKISKDTLFLVAGATTVSRKFPHLLEPLNIITGRFLNQGLYDFWLNQQKVVNKVKGRRISSKIREPEIANTKSHGLPLIIIISIGFSLSILVFIIELISFRFSNRKVNKSETN